MGKYGQTAVLAVQLVQNGKIENLREAWKIASKQIFGEWTTSQKKECPKCAFLGICEEGKVIGILSGEYTTSIKNKGYALKTLELIKKDRSLLNNKNKLWKQIVDMQEEGQLDVVISLYNAGLIN